MEKLTVESMAGVYLEVVKMRQRVQNTNQDEGNA